MLHHPSKLQNCVTGSLQIPNTPLEIQIHNEVPIVRDKGLLLLPKSPKLGNTPSLLKQLAQPLGREPPTKRNNLNGHGQSTSPHIVDKLGLINNDNKLLARALHHLLPQEGAAATLDEVEKRVNLVGAVDGQIDDGVGVEIGQGDPEGECLFVSHLGGGYPDDVFEFALAEKLADAFDSVLGGGASAKAENHAGFNVLDGLVGGDLLKVILGEDDGGGGGRVEKAGVHGSLLGGNEMGVWNGHLNGSSKWVKRPKLEKPQRFKLVVEERRRERERDRVRGLERVAIVWVYIENSSLVQTLRFCGLKINKRVWRG